ncbi:MAG TPA: acyl-CoA dehydrogenase family protein [Miltoncostaeaceae bacterium]|nr:acyl-CoA dehydrogenase family protein [Miltoncostaeaceae bacterium]
MTTAPPLAGSDIYLTDELLGDEERAVRDRVRRFCDEEVAPVINGYWERAEFPFELVPKLARLDVCGGTIQGHGCPGLSPLAAGLVAMELARGDGSVSTFYGVHSGLAMTAIGLLGSEEQKDRWLPAMARLDAIGAFALTEPDHGSDAVTLETRVRRLGDGYVIDGAKRWIGNATFADLMIVWARDATGEVGAYVVEKGAPGVEARLITGKVAKRASWQADVTLTDVRVPAENRLAEASSFDDAARVLAAARPGIAWAALGHAVAGYEAAVAYALEREQFGTPIGGYQITQYRLAKMLADVTGMRLICMRLAELVGQGALTPAMASLAKMHNAARARAVVAEARDLLGGNGLLLENHVARHLGDVEVTATVEGTDAVHALIVGREITGMSAFS